MLGLVPRPRDLALGCQSRMQEGGIVPPHSVLAPGTALGLLPSRALSSAQVRGIVGARQGLAYRTEKGGGRKDHAAAGCSIRAALRRLEIPPVRANSRCVLDAAARARKGPCQQHDALVGVAWTARNSH